MKTKYRKLVKFRVSISMLFILLGVDSTKIPEEKKEWTH